MKLRAKPCLKDPEMILLDNTVTGINLKPYRTTKCQHFLNVLSKYPSQGSAVMKVLNRILFEILFKGASPLSASTSAFL